MSGLAIVAGLAGCSGSLERADEILVNGGKQIVAAQLPTPATARFQNLRVVPDRHGNVLSLCGDVDWADRAGQRVPPQHFMVIPKDHQSIFRFSIDEAGRPAQLAGGPAEFDRIWQGSCEGPDSRAYPGARPQPSNT